MLCILTERLVEGGASPTNQSHGDEVPLSLRVADRPEVAFTPQKDPRRKIYTVPNRGLYSLRMADELENTADGK